MSRTGDTRSPFTIDFVPSQSASVESGHRHALAVQALLGAVVNDWLKVGRVGLALEPRFWDETMWQVEVSCGGGDLYNLFGALAYRMFLTVDGEESLYVCDACKNLYIRTAKTPSPGQQNFCDDIVCRKISLKRAVERYRSSAKQKRTNKKKRGTKK